MNFYSPTILEKILQYESPPQVYKSVFSRDEINELIELEKLSHSLRMVDRVDSRKTKIEWKSRVKEIISDKLEKTLDFKIFFGDFPAHFIKNRYPLRIHADMGKDPNLIPYKNILLPLYVKGSKTTFTCLFKKKWYGPSSLFSANTETDSDHFFKDRNNKFFHIKDSCDFLEKMKANINKEIDYSGGKFFCSKQNIEEIEALLNQSRYSERTNKHISNNVPFNLDDYNKYLTHQPYEDLTSLELDQVIPWHPGDVVTFDRSTIHCASNFILNGVQEKMAIAMFTVLEGTDV